MITTGPLPPISSSATLPAAAWATSRPVVVEPMKATPCTAGIACDLVAHHWPRAGHEVEHAGRDVGLGDAARQRDAHTAVDGAGVQTTVLPHASAGAMSSAGIV